jgi:hypothetical protein
MTNKKNTTAMGAALTAAAVAVGKAAGVPVTPTDAPDTPEVEAPEPGHGNAGDIPGPERAIYRVEHDPAPVPAEDNPSIIQQKAAIKQAMGLLSYAATFLVNIPDPDGDREVDFVSDEKNGEVETVRCRAANRYGRTERGLLDQTLRQLSFALEQDKKAIADEQRNLRGMFNTLTRSDDPERIRDAMAKKADWIDVLADRCAHTQALLDAGNEAYIDLRGEAYVAYEKRAPRTLSIPAAPTDDALLQRVRGLITG